MEQGRPGCYLFELLRCGRHPKAAGRKPAGIAFQGEDIFATCILFRGFGIGQSSPQSVLLVHEHNSPYGALRPDAQRLHDPNNFDALHTTTTVVMRSFCKIPAVEMPAHRDDLIGELTAPHFSNHVERRHILKHLSIAPEPKTPYSALLQLVAQHLCILRTDGHGRQFGEGIIVSHGSGMRMIIHIGGERTNDHPHSTIFCGL